MNFKLKLLACLFICILGLNAFGANEEDKEVICQAQEKALEIIESHFFEFNSYQRDYKGKRDMYKKDAFGSMNFLVANIGELSQCSREDIISLGEINWKLL